MRKAHRILTQTPTPPTHPPFTPSKPIQRPSFFYLPVAVPEVEPPDLDRLVGRGRGDELVVVRNVQPHYGQLVPVQAACITMWMGRNAGQGCEEGSGLCGCVEEW